MSEALTLERGFMRSRVRAARSAALGLVGAAALWTGGCGLILGLDEYSPAADAHCANGVKDADEPAVDCGGTACAGCADGERCVSSADCVSQVCGGGTCQAPACSDGAMNGTETDVDCGGSCGATCGPEKVCATDADCRGGACGGGVCEPTCTDAAKSGKETAIDCGGPDCGACALGEGCEQSADCETGVCRVGVCANYFQWAERFGDAATQVGRSVAFDSEGSVLVAGRFEGSIQFGDVPLTSGGSSDMFLAKRDASGKHVWAKRFGATGDQAAVSVAVDAARNVFVAGTGMGSFAIGGGSLENAGATDAYLAKLDATGKHQWSTSFGGSGSDAALDVLVDGSGNVTLVGTFQGTVDFGGGPLTADPGVGFGIFVVRLDASGMHLWSTMLDVFDPSARAAVLSSGAVVLTGTFGGTVDFGGGPLTNDGEGNVFVVMLDNSGKHLWSKQFGNAAHQEGRCVATDTSGNVYLGGRFRGGINLGGDTFTTDGRALFLAKLSSTGSHVWSKHFEGDNGFKDLTGVVVAPSSDVFLTGYFGGSLDFGASPLMNGQNYDVFVAALDGSGNPVSAMRFGDDESPQFAYAIAVSADADVSVTGEFTGAIDFGGGELASVGSSDMYLTKLTPP